MQSVTVYAVPRRAKFVKLLENDFVFFFCCGPGTFLPTAVGLLDFELHDCLLNGLDGGLGLAVFLPDQFLYFTILHACLATTRIAKRITKRFGSVVHLTSAAGVHCWKQTIL